MSLQVWNHPDILWLAKEAKDAKELKASKLASAAVDEFEEGAAEVPAGMRLRRVDWM